MRSIRSLFGHPLKCRLGNGAGTQYTYNQLGMLTGIRDGIVNYQNIIIHGDEGKYYDIGSQYRNLAYTYNSRGFIQSRTDSTAMQCETYTYDNLDRLSSYTVNGTQTLAFSYGTNGNITFNPKAGTYSYSSSRPHAVNQVTGVPANASPMPPQCDVTYNLMNRPETLLGGGYSVSLDYNADGVRRHTSVSHYNSPIKEKTRLSKLFETEETTTANRRIDYIYAEGRVVAARVYENGNGHLYYVLADHLGSWERVLDGSRNTVQKTHFDPWGNRMDFNAWATPQTQTSFLFDRGFTGHEHYDFLHVINANARLYDPVIGRFFSPDPFVQAPDLTQNYNRYSYCMNNPVMYSDPDGELFGTISGLVSDVFYNLFLKSDQDEGWDWSRTENGWKIDMGLLETDPNKSGWGRFWEVVSRFTWQSPQVFTGYGLSLVKNIGGAVDRVEYLGDATYVINENWEKTRKQGVTLGNYINIDMEGEVSYNESFSEYVTRDNLFMHEFGHIIQSKRWGPLYPISIAFPSGISQLFDNWEWGGMIMIIFIQKYGRTEMRLSIFLICMVILFGIIMSIRLKKENSHEKNYKTYSCYYGGIFFSTSLCYG